MQRKVVVLRHWLGLSVARDGRRELGISRRHGEEPLLARAGGDSRGQVTAIGLGSARNSRRPRTLDDDPAPRSASWPPRPSLRSRRRDASSPAPSRSRRAPHRVSAGATTTPSRRSAPATTLTLAASQDEITAHHATPVSCSGKHTRVTVVGQAPAPARVDWNDPYLIATKLQHRRASTRSKKPSAATSSPAEDHLPPTWFYPTDGPEDAAGAKWIRCDLVQYSGESPSLCRCPSDRHLARTASPRPPCALPQRDRSVRIACSNAHAWRAPVVAPRRELAVRGRSPPDASRRWPPRSAVCPASSPAAR